MTLQSLAICRLSLWIFSSNPASFRPCVRTFGMIPVSYQNLLVFIDCIIRIFRVFHSSWHHTSHSTLSGHSSTASSAFHLNPAHSTSRRKTRRWLENLDCKFALQHEIMRRYLREPFEVSFNIIDINNASTSQSTLFVCVSPKFGFFFFRKKKIGKSKHFACRRKKRFVWKQFFFHKTLI